MIRDGDSCGRPDGIEHRDGGTGLGDGRLGRCQCARRGPGKGRPRGRLLGRRCRRGRCSGGWCSGGWCSRGCSRGRTCDRPRDGLGRSARCSLSRRRCGRGQQADGAAVGLRPAAVAGAGATPPLHAEHRSAIDPGFGRADGRSCVAVAVGSDGGRSPRSSSMRRSTSNLSSAARRAEAVGRGARDGGTAPSVCGPERGPGAGGGAERRATSADDRSAVRAESTKPLAVGAVGSGTDRARCVLGGRRGKRAGTPAHPARTGAAPGHRVTALGAGKRRCRRCLTPHGGRRAGVHGGGRAGWHHGARAERSAQRHRVGRRRRRRREDCGAEPTHPGDRPARAARRWRACGATRRPCGRCARRMQGRAWMVWSPPWRAPTTLPMAVPPTPIGERRDGGSPESGVGSRSRAVAVSRSPPSSATPAPTGARWWHRGRERRCRARRRRRVRPSTSPAGGAAPGSRGWSHRSGDGSTSSGRSPARTPRWNARRHR